MRLYICEINLLLISSFENILPHYMGCLFILFIVLFAGQKFLNLIRSHLFVFVSIVIEHGSKKILLQYMLRVFCLCFPLRVLQCQALH